MRPEWGSKGRPLHSSQTERIRRREKEGSSGTEERTENGRERGRKGEMDGWRDGGR